MQEGAIAERVDEARQAAGVAASCFTPDEHTATVCFQVLKAALASVAGARG